MWYWSADTLFWQVSTDHNMDVQCQGSTRKIKAACLCQPIIWSMAAMLGNSVVVVVRTRPRAIPLAMITMRKSTYGFRFLSYMSMGLRLAALRAAGAPLVRVGNNGLQVCHQHFLPTCLPLHRWYEPNKHAQRFQNQSFLSQINTAFFYQIAHTNMWKKRL